MNKSLKFLIMAQFAVTCPFLLSGQGQYSDHNQMTRKVDDLSRKYPDLCSVKSLTKTQTGKDIWILTLGTGDRDNKPAIAVLGGIEGSYLLGRELCAGFAENILRNQSKPEIKALLDKVTFYIVPDVSPDASEQYFSTLKYERNANGRPTDDDRDFVVNEDPYEDLNKDGYISLIRIYDPSGRFTESDEDRRIMVEADLAKGQKGGYLVYSEGFDNDSDGKWNEDGEGGVNFNRNFTYNYEEFGLNSGRYPVSEPEVKALADFLYERYNIYALIVFGPQDNLGQPWKASDRPEQTSELQMLQGPGSGTDPGPQQGRMRISRKFTAILKTDETINKLVSDKYHELTGAKGSPANDQAPGNFLEWAYYHYGRYSFGTTGWWYPVEKGKNREAAFLKFAEKNKMENVFIPWTMIKHPDFPDKTAEVGGIKPFALINPPADTLDYLIESHSGFIIKIAEMHPELEFLDIETEDAGENVFRLSLKVHNKGIFATCPEAGDMNLWTRIMRITLDPGKGQSIVSGMKVQRIPRLQGDGTAEFSWLISGKGQVAVTAGAANTGIIETTVNLR